MEGKYTRSAKLLAAGFGLVSMVMVGCQQTEPQSAASDAMTTEALRLGIKQTDSCKADLKALHDAFIAAKGDSTLMAALIEQHASFVTACVEKTEPVIKDGGAHLKHPPALTPDSAACAWKVDAMDDKDSGVEVHYRHECSDKGHKSGMKGEIHKLPEVEGPEHDSDLVRPERPEMDSAHPVMLPPKGGEHGDAISFPPLGDLGHEGKGGDCDSTHVVPKPVIPHDSASAA